MALTSPVDFSMRTEDKGFDFITPSTLADPFTDIFDQYVNGDESDSSDGHKALGCLDDLNGLFEAGASSDDSAHLSPIRGSARHAQSPPQPWRKGLWCLGEDRASSPRNISLEPSPNTSAPVEPPSLVRLDLLSLDSIKLPQTCFPAVSPSTPPATPSLKKTKNLKSGSKTIGRKKPDGRRTLFRKRSISPSLMRPGQYRHNEMALPEAWQQHFQNFNLHNSRDALPLSPPASGRVIQEENPARLAGSYGLVNSSSDIRNARATASNHGLGLVNAGLTHQYSPHLHHPVDNHHNIIAQAPTASRLQSNQAHAGLTSPQAVPQSQYQHMPNWMSDGYDSTENHYPYQLVSGSESNNGQGQPWWSPPASVTQPYGPMPQQDSYYPMMAAPAPQRPAHGILQPSELQHSGLGIHYDAPQPGLHSAAPDYSAPALSPGYPALSQQRRFPQPSPFATPRQKESSPVRTPSPLSPTATPVITNGTRSVRRKSHGAHSHQRGHSKSGSITKTPRTPKTPNTPHHQTSTSTGGGGFAVDFVNFTPNDSRKILTGVAPSGSSKTKARREQEAKERRRKLSEAALRAVQRAGGDIEALEAAILC